MLLAGGVPNCLAGIEASYVTDLERTSDWTDEYRTMIEDCRKRERHLSAWDADFLDSIEERLDWKKPMSRRQRECLEEIWERATAKD